LPLLQKTTRLPRHSIFVIKKKHEHNHSYLRIFHRFLFLIVLISPFVQTRKNHTTKYQIYPYWQITMSSMQKNTHTITTHSTLQLLQTVRPMQKLQTKNSQSIPSNRTFMWNRLCSYNISTKTKWLKCNTNKQSSPLSTTNQSTSLSHCHL